jgi:hypothetical protein
MNNLLAWIAIIGGVIGSLVAYGVVPVSAVGETWHDKFGKLFKILGPVAIVIGLIILLF